MSKVTDLEAKAKTVVDREIRRFLARIEDHIEAMPDELQSPMHMVMVGMLLAEARHMQSTSSAPSYCEHVAAARLQKLQTEEVRNELYLGLIEMNIGSTPEDLN